MRDVRIRYEERYVGNMEDVICKMFNVACMTQIMGYDMTRKTQDVEQNMGCKM